jgi:hypothetical protein
VVANTKCEVAALASVTSVCVGLARHYGGGHVRKGRILASVTSVGVGLASQCGGGQVRRGRLSGLCSIGRRGLSQPLMWQERQFMALVCPLFDGLAWALAPTVVAGATVEGADLAHVR